VSELFNPLFVSMAISAAALTVAVVFCYVVPPLASRGLTVLEMHQDQKDVEAHERQQARAWESVKNGIKDEVDNQMDSDRCSRSWWGGLRPDECVIEAARQSQRIETTLQVLKGATAVCPRVQFRRAQAMGAVMMSELKQDPLSLRLQWRVVAITEVALEELVTYPDFFRSGELMEQFTALEMMRRSCLCCEYRDQLVDSCSALCSPAIAMGNRPPHVES
jgi:hypothetical protein